MLDIFRMNVTAKKKPGNQKKGKAGKTKKK